MDDGQCEREGTVLSEGQEGGVDLHCNQSDPSETNQVSADQNQNRTQTQLDDGQRAGQNSLNNNVEEEEEEGRTVKGEEDGDEDDVIVDEEEEDSSVTCGQSPDTPMTDCSFSDTGSPVELRPSVSPETTDPISSQATSPDEPCYSDPAVETHTSTTGPTTSSSEPTTSTTSPTCTTGPTTSTTSPTCTTEPTTSTTSPTCTTEPTTSTTGPTCTTGPTSSTTGPTCTTGPTSSTTGPTCTIGPTIFTTGPTTSTAEPSPALLATLQELGERGDHSHLPQYLHQVAEAFVLQEDYERAVWCVQLERLYHQRLLHNLTTLQDQWERRRRADGRGERNSNTDLTAQQLDVLTHICKTHQRPSPGEEKAVDSVLKSPVRGEDRLPTCRSVRLFECLSGMEEDQRGTDSTLSQSINPIKSAGALKDSLSSNDCAALGVAQDCRDSQGIGRAEFTDSRSEGMGQQTEREMEHTTQDGCTRPDRPTDGEMSQPKHEEQQGGEEKQEEVEEAEEALALDKEEKRDGVDCLKAPLEEFSALAVKEQLTLEEAQLREEEYDMFGVDMVETIRDRVASLDDLAKRITVEEMTPVPGLVSILKRRSVCVEDVCVAPFSAPPKHKLPAKRRVRFKVPDDGFDHDEVGGDSCLLLFLLCLVTVVISLGGTALYCALGDAQSTVCTDFSRNADFYLAQLHRGMDQLQNWLTPGS